MEVVKLDVREGVNTLVLVDVMTIALSHALEHVKEYVAIIVTKHAREEIKLI